MVERSIFCRSRQAWFEWVVYPFYISLFKYCYRRTMMASILSLFFWLRKQKYHVLIGLFSTIAYYYYNRHGTWKIHYKKYRAQSSSLFNILGKMSKIWFLLQKGCAKLEFTEFAHLINYSWPHCLRRNA